MSLTWILLLLSGSSSFLSVLTNPVRRHQGIPIRDQLTGVPIDPIIVDAIRPDQLSGIIPGRKFPTGIVVDPEQFGKRNEKPIEGDEVGTAQSTGIVVKRNGQRKALPHHQIQMTGIIDHVPDTIDKLRADQLTGIIDASREFPVGTIVDPDQFGKRNDQRKDLAEDRPYQLTGIIDHIHDSDTPEQLIGVLTDDDIPPIGIVADSDQFGKRNEQRKDLEEDFPYQLTGDLTGIHPGGDVPPIGIVADSDQFGKRNEQRKDLAEDFPYQLTGDLTGIHPGGDIPPIGIVADSDQFGKRNEQRKDLAEDFPYQLTGDLTGIHPGGDIPPIGIVADSDQFRKLDEKPNESDNA